MRLARRPQREAPETIIALIDVVFFLLVFFLLVGRMDATAPFEVEPPLAETGTPMPGGGATIAVAASGELALNGAPASREAALEGIGRALAENPAVLVRINAHRDAELRQVLPLAAEIEALGARDVILVVTPGGS